ncbi:MAG: hypothetical protein CMJ45_13810 [Planctomyces sp.]|jgi:ectoine hydroxylase-related dioxygenase (phytanoyl-CoA dioxygenase family)|nr:hypothetical protein [Planctomyces sp.]
MTQLVAHVSNPAEYSSKFDREGVLVVDPLVEEEAIGQLRQRTDEIAEGQVLYPDSLIELEPGTSTVNRSTIRKINVCHLHDDLFAAHAAHPGILDVIEDLIGPDIKIFSSQLFMKPPGGIAKTWHQDLAYFPLDPQLVVTCWTALDDVTLENGCLELIPGTHRTGILDHNQVWMVGDRRDMRIPDSEIDTERSLAITMSAGGCSFHHGILLHRSGPNTTTVPRRGLAVHYIPGNCRWIGNPDEEPVFPVVRGRDTTG